MGTFSSSFIGHPVLHPMDGCEHTLLYLSGTGRASQETTISGSCQWELAGIHNSVWVGNCIDWGVNIQFCWAKGNSRQYLTQMLQVKLYILMKKKMCSFGNSDKQLSCWSPETLPAWRSQVGSGRHWLAHVMPNLRCAEAHFNLLIAANCPIIKAETVGWTNKQLTC